MNTRKLVTDAMLVAMYVALSMIGTIDLVTMKISVASLPIIVGALLYGPVDGLLIGFVGAFAEQVLKYGFSATTILWCLPAMSRGLIVGLCASKFGFDLDFKRMMAALVPAAIAVTLINTGVWYLDSKIYGYYSAALVFGDFTVRIVSGIFTMLVFTAILPSVLRALNKVLHRTQY